MKYVFEESYCIVSLSGSVFTRGYKLACQFFASCRDCLSYLVSVETVCNIFLPSKTTVHETFCQGCLHVYASCQAESHGQSQQLQLEH